MMHRYDMKPLWTVKFTIADADGIRENVRLVALARFALTFVAEFTALWMTGAP